MRKEIPSSIFDILLDLLYPGDSNAEETNNRIKTALTENFKASQSEGNNKFENDNKEIFAKLENYPVAKKAITAKLIDPDFLKDKYDDWSEIL